MKLITRCGVGLLLLLSVAAAQDIDSAEVSGKKAPSVTLTAPALVTVVRGKPGKINLNFHVAAGFHVNSNSPKAEYLIPTTLKLEPPTDIVIGKTTYPAGEDVQFPFSADEKLNVYSGAFTIAVLVRPLASVLAGKYEVRGELKYQACDNSACYPPKKLPVDFEVKVVKAPPAATKNPAQSPHAHR